MKSTEKTMKPLQLFIRWLERRYTRKLEKFSLSRVRGFEAAARPRLRDHGDSMILTHQANAGYELRQVVSTTSPLPRCGRVATPGAFPQRTVKH
jgi:hypothetical protein